MQLTDSFSRLEQLLPQLFQANQQPGDAYLRFLLTPDLPTLIEMETVQESLLVPAEYITPIPNMPEWMLGLMSSRNAVFSVVDFAQMLGLPTVVNARQYHVVVVRTFTPDRRELLLGLVVNKIQGLTRVISEQIQSPLGSFPESLTPYLQGCVYSGEERMLLLSIEAIARTLWQK